MATDPIPTPTPPQRTAFVSWMMANAPILGTVLVILIFVGIIVSVFAPFIFAPALPDKTLLQYLTDAAAARGLITFLVAVSTVSIAIILLVFVILSTGTEDVKARYPLGKEVLTALIGILGTIIGFYFGSTHDQSSTPASATAAALVIAELAVTPPNPKKTDELTIDATISGGKPDYKYTLRFVPDTIQPIDGTSRDGKVSRKIQLPADYDIAKPLLVTLEASDVEDSVVAGRRLRVDISP
jgi:hypothetical protein